MSNFLSGLARSVSCPEAIESGCGLRLPAVASRLERLREQLVEFEDVPYARVERKLVAADEASSFSATTALPVVAERLSLPEEVRDFDPTPYLSPEIIEDPDAFLKAPEDMPGPIKIRGTASRKELIKVFE